MGVVLENDCAYEYKGSTACSFIRVEQHRMKNTQETTRYVKAEHCIKPHRLSRKNFEVWKVAWIC